MANISEEENRRDYEERTANNGKRLHGREFPSNARATAYNTVHGTSFHDDSSLAAYFANGGK